MLSNLNNKSTSRFNMDITLNEFASSSNLNYSSYFPPNLPSEDGWLDLMREPRLEFDPNFKNPCWMKNNVLHCLPYMLLIGVKKCGTTYLISNIQKHPDFARPGFNEAHWFAHKRFNGKTGIESYAHMFSKAAATIVYKSVRLPNGNISNNRLITGEKSPSNLNLNLHWKWTANLQEPQYVNLDHIHHFMPSVKIIVLFRDPVDRLYSDYYHEYGTLMRTHHPDPEEFHRIVKQSLPLYEKCFQERSVRSCVYDGDITEPSRFQIQLGIYYIYWNELLRVFPRNNIHVLQYEELRTDFRRSLKAIFKFLDIEKLSDHDMALYGITSNNNKKTTKQKRRPMLEETATMLNTFYQRFNKIMAIISGDDTFLYKRNSSAKF